MLTHSERIGVGSGDIVERDCRAWCSESAEGFPAIIPLDTHSKLAIVRFMSVALLDCDLPFLPLRSP